MTESFYGVNWESNVLEQTFTGRFTEGTALFHTHSFKFSIKSGLWIASQSSHICTWHNCIKKHLMPVSMLSTPQFANCHSLQHFPICLQGTKAHQCCPAATAPHSWQRVSTAGWLTSHLLSVRYAKCYPLQTRTARALMPPHCWLMVLLRDNTRHWQITSRCLMVWKPCNSTEAPGTLNTRPLISHR